MSEKTKEIIYWLFVLFILCPVTIFGAWKLAEFGAYLEQYIGEVLSDLVMVLISLICGYGLKIISELDNS